MYDKIPEIIVRSIYKYDHMKTKISQMTKKFKDYKQSLKTSDILRKYICSPVTDRVLSFLIKKSPINGLRKSHRKGPKWFLNLKNSLASFTLRDIKLKP